MKWLNKVWLKLLDVLPIIFGIMVIIILLMLGLAIIIGLFDLLRWMIGGI